MIKKQNNYKKTIQLLRSHFSDRFQKAIELFQSKILSVEDINFFCDNEPTISYVIENLKKKTSEELKKEANKAILKRDSALIDISLKNVENEKAILSDEFARLMISEPVTANDVLQKQVDLNNLQDRIKACDIIYSDLENCKNKNFKANRGRPLKKENKDLIELATAYKDNKANTNKLDEDIISLLYQLSEDEKRYIIIYINKMIETRNNICKE